MKMFHHFRNMAGWQARVTSFIVALFLVALGVSV